MPDHRHFRQTLALAWLAAGVLAALWMPLDLAAASGKSLAYWLLAAPLLTLAAVHVMPRATQTPHPQPSRTPHHPTTRRPLTRDHAHQRCMHPEKRGGARNFAR